MFLSFVNKEERYSYIYPEYLTLLMTCAHQPCSRELALLQIWGKDGIKIAYSLNFMAL